MYACELIAKIQNPFYGCKTRYMFLFVYFMMCQIKFVVLFFLPNSTSKGIEVKIPFLIPSYCSLFVRDCIINTEKKK